MNQISEIFHIPQKIFNGTPLLVTQINFLSSKLKLCRDSISYSAKCFKLKLSENSTKFIMKRRLVSGAYALIFGPKTSKFTRL